MIFVYIIYAIVAVIAAFLVIRDLRGKVITIGDVVTSLFVIAAAPAVAILILVGWVGVAISSLDFWETVLYDPNSSIDT
jgi:hypothetical protein